jgi:hypothetical protein
MAGGVFLLAMNPWEKQPERFVEIFQPNPYKGNRTV